MSCTCRVLYLHNFRVRLPDVLHTIEIILRILCPSFLPGYRPLTCVFRVTLVFMQRMAGDASRVHELHACPPVSNQ